MAARHPVNQRLCPALNGIATGFAQPLATRDVAFDFFGRQTLEADDAVAKATAHPSVRVNHGHRAQNMVAAAIQQLQKPALHIAIGRLRQDAAADCDRGIACDDNFTCCARNSDSLLLGHAQRVDARHFALARCFVNVRRSYAVRHHAKTRKQFAPARA